MVKNAQEWLNEVFPSKEERSKLTELKNIGQKWLFIGWGMKIELPWKEPLEGELDLREFSNLEKLDCSSSGINSLNIRGLTKLKKLNCSGNQISKLELSDNTNLDTLYCHNNSLKEIIGLEKLKKLTSINSSGNKTSSDNDDEEIQFSLVKKIENDINNAKKLLVNYEKLMDNEITACQRIIDSDMFSEFEKEKVEKEQADYKAQILQLNILIEKWN